MARPAISVTDLSHCWQCSVRVRVMALWLGDLLSVLLISQCLLAV